jgi:hypothetical protein
MIDFIARAYPQALPQLRTDFSQAEDAGLRMPRPAPVSARDTASPNAEDVTAADIAGAAARQDGARQASRRA